MVPDVQLVASVACSHMCAYSRKDGIAPLRAGGASDACGWWFNADQRDGYAASIYHSTVQLWGEPVVSSIVRLSDPLCVHSHAHRQAGRPLHI
jgi:hypothetical protein